MESHEAGIGWQKSQAAPVIYSFFSGSKGQEKKSGDCFING
jgi:hypothetical protein